MREYSVELWDAGRAPKRPNAPPRASKMNAFRRLAHAADWNSVTTMRWVVVCSDSDWVGLTGTA